MLQANGKELRGDFSNPILPVGLVICQLKTSWYRYEQDSRLDTCGVETIRYPVHFLVEIKRLPPTMEFTNASICQANMRIMSMWAKELRRVSMSKQIEP